MDTCHPKEEAKPIPIKPIEKNHRIPALACPAPNWTGIAVANLKFQTLSLKDFEGKYIVLVFYPYDFTFVCPVELSQFSERLDEFSNLKCDVVAISTDSEYSHYAWITTPKRMGGLGGTSIPIVADKNREISRIYGVLDEEEGICFKATFVIDKKQTIRHVTVSDLSVSRSIDETLRVVEACQYADLASITCPLGPNASSAVQVDDYFDVN